MKAGDIERLRFAVERAELLAGALGDTQVHIPRALASALLALAEAVQSAPVVVAKTDAHPWPTIDDIDAEEGQRFRLVPDCGPTAEAKEGV